MPFLPSIQGSVLPFSAGSAPLNSICSPSGTSESIRAWMSATPIRSAGLESTSIMRCLRRLDRRSGFAPSAPPSRIVHRATSARKRARFSERRQRRAACSAVRRPRTAVRTRTDVLRLPRGRFLHPDRPRLACVSARPPRRTQGSPRNNCTSRRFAPPPPAQLPASGRRGRRAAAVVRPAIPANPANPAQIQSAYAAQGGAPPMSGECEITLFAGWRRRAGWRSTDRGGTDERGERAGAAGGRGSRGGVLWKLRIRDCGGSTSATTLAD